ncbi:MAG TPA: PVC-type heme-binding CxxCH protein, partial [Humisphaera sp.]
AADAPPPGPVAGPRVKVLFLGDDGHHKPLERYRQVAGEMTRRGVDLTYTDDLKQITPSNLARFDALLLYANTTKAPPEVEKAILDYVAGGKGYAVIHCGSFCWLNSQPLTELAGGRFKRHGTGVFKETHVAKDSPVLKGLSEIQSWDESYVHEMHNEKDRQVLSVREDKEGKEPYTWTRTHGKGRVFYTAWGHDERTWGNKDFADLLERGVRWSAGDAFLAPKSTLPAFEYGEGRAPNYVVSNEWGKTGTEITKIQKPVPADVSVKHMVLPPRVEAKLFAGEPKIFKPIAMNWDERGRLFVAETVDYPNEMQQPGQGRDRISILEDTDGDGVADKYTVFADKLSIPTSLCFANGGVIVAQAPDILFLKDTDGDGVADVRKVLVTGWGTRDTHAGPSNLHYGLDNWVYGIVGYSGFNGEVDGKRLSFAQAVWRMRPDGTKLESLGSVTNNAWGVGISEEGNVFASTANGDPSFYLHIPNRAYESVRGLNVRRLPNIADTAALYPATTAVRQVDHHGKMTAGAGHELYTARTWPSYYWNRVAFVAEPTGHLVMQFLLQPNGSGFAARNDASLLASTDEWTSPICAQVGPDGQVWVTDWYNFIVQHNPIPKGWKGGKGGAYESELRDKTHGRIYRLVYQDGTPSKQFKLTKDDPGTLLAALKSDNMGWRLHAQRLLVERGDKAVAGELLKLVADTSVDAIGLNPPAIHALWTLQGLGLLDGGNADATAAAVAALKHPSAGVRKAAADVLPRTDAGLAALLSAKALDDADAQVRKSALLAIAEMPQAGEASAAAGQAVYAFLGKPETANDPWLPDAATIAAARHDAAFLAAALAAFKAPETPAAAPKVEAPRNLMPNPSFEEVVNGAPRGWKPRNYSGTSSQELSTAGGRTGSNALVLKSETGSDTSWFAEVPVEPNTQYRLSAWIKTENVKAVRGGMGALLNVHLTEYKTKPVTGTSDWTQVSVTFNSGRSRTVSINCLYGGWGHATGVAYYDDIELVKVAGGPAANLPGATGRALSAVITHYAQRAPKESVVRTLASLKAAQPMMATLVVDALAAAWPEGKAFTPDLTPADEAELKATMAALPAPAKDRLLALSTKWGRADLFGAALADMLKELAATVDDTKAPAAKRTEAARRLIAVADGADSVATVTKHVTAAEGPD